MIGMTGSSQSFIETASEQDIDKLKAKFSEYATIKKREHLVKAIEERAQATATPLLLSAPQGWGQGTINTFSSITPAGTDGEKCKIFLSLCSIGNTSDELENGPVVAASSIDDIHQTARGPASHSAELKPKLSKEFEITAKTPIDIIRQRDASSPEKMEKILDDFVRSSNGFAPSSAPITNRRRSFDSTSTSSSGSVISNVVAMAARSAALSDNNNHQQDGIGHANNDNGAHAGGSFTIAAGGADGPTFRVTSSSSPVPQQLFELTSACRWC